LLFAISLQALPSRVTRGIYADFCALMLGKDLTPLIEGEYGFSSQRIQLFWYLRRHWEGASRHPRASADPTPNSSDRNRKL